MESVALNNREVAALIWLGVFAIFALWLGRAHVRPVLVSLANPKMSLFFLGFFAYVGIVVFLLERVDLWNPSMTPDAVAWTALVGIPLLVGSVSHDERKLRRLLAGTVSLTILLEAFVNLKVFPLPIELVLLPLVSVLVAIEAVAASQPDAQQAKQLAGKGLAIIGTTLIVYVAISTTVAWHGVSSELFLKLLLPLELTVGVVPFLIAVWFYAVFERRVLLRRNRFV